MVDQTVASNLVLALQRMVPAARAGGLGAAADILEEALGVVSYEGAGFRIPKCTECHTPRGDDDAVRRINRDRAFPDG